MALAGPTGSLITPQQTFGNSPIESSRADLNWMRRVSSALGRVSLLKVIGGTVPLTVKVWTEPGNTE